MSCKYRNVSTNSSPLIVWPGLNNLRLTLPLSLFVFLTFYTFYGAASFITSLHPWRLRLYFNFELTIPFWPQWAVVYLSLNVMLGLAPFIFPRWQALLPLALTMVIEILVASLIFIVLPLEDGFTHTNVTGLTGYFFKLADTVNLEHNYLPSLHVTFAVTAALAFSTRCRLAGRALFMGWVLAISASTVLIHEHHLLDILFGMLLAMAAMRLVYKQVATEVFINNFKIEIICLTEFSYFIRRHVRYLFTFLGIYRYALPNWSQGRIVRATYCLAQHVDDVLDGDRIIQTEPKTYVCRLIHQVETNDQSQTEPMNLLISYILRESATYEKTPGEFRENLLNLFRILLFDLQRREKKLLLSAQELAKQHHLTFVYSANLTLIIARSKLRADDIPEFMGALSWCSPIRDLQEDLQRGLINIPKAIVEQARKQGADSLDYDALIATPAVKLWLQSEFRQGKSYIEQATDKADQLHDDAGAFVLVALAKTLKLYVNRYAKRNKALLAPVPPPEKPNVRLF